MAWFKEWERVRLADVYAGQGPDPIYCRGIGPKTKLLDVGCGPGFWVRFFLRHGVRQVSACDLTPRAIELTRKSLDLFGLHGNVELKVGNAEQLPYEDNSFDHVNCDGVIHHTPRPGRCIAEFRRVLRPGGTLCFSVYYKNLPLRHPQLLRMAGRLFRPLVQLRGRGREGILANLNAEEIVRQYDGAANPIGIAFSSEEAKSLLEDRFQLQERARLFFPARALPLKVPRAMHRILNKHFGLMLALKAVRLP